MISETRIQFRVAVGCYRADGSRLHGKYITVAAATREEAADLAEAKAVAQDEADVRVHNAYAEQFGGWKRKPLRWQVEEVRKSPVRAVHPI